MAVVFVLFATCMIVLCNLVVVMVSRDRLYENTDSLPDCAVALVLGAPPLRRDGSRNLFFDYRVQAVIMLFLSGKVEKIVLSGNCSETRAMLSELESNGVPLSSIIVDAEGVRTALSLRHVKENLGSVRLVIVSQRFHNYRAVFLARCMGMDVVGFNARSVRSQRWLLVFVRELFARMRVYADLLCFSCRRKS